MDQVVTPHRTTALIDEPKTPPVKIFAVAGFLILCVYAHTLFLWVTSPYFKPSPVGPDPIPSWLLHLIRFTEVFCAALIVLFFWKLLIQPWIKTKSITWDGTLMLALITLWVQDPMCNYFNFTFMYNAYFINMGSWSSFLPGWQSPRGSNLPEPIFLMGGIYVWWTTIQVLAFSWSLGKLRQWLPRLSTLAHIPIAFACIVALDLCLELPAGYFGLFAYPGAPHALTLWPGKPYQFPIYETILINCMYLPIGLLRYYRDDKGESFAERGLGRLDIPKSAKPLMRFFAIAGFCNICYFSCYFMPYNWFAMQSDSFAHYPSYMLVGICGRGTPYACPSREVPVPSRASLDVIGPNDPRLTPDARQN